MALKDKQDVQHFMTNVIVPGVEEYMRCLEEDARYNITELEVDDDGDLILVVNEEDIYLKVHWL